MKRATSTPAGLNVKKITAYLKGQAKSRNAVRITCQSGSVYIITGYAAFKLPAILYRDVIQPVTMQDAPADGVTIVSSDAGFVVNDPHQLTAAQMFQKFSACKEEVKRTSILQEVEAKGKVWGTFRMFRNGHRRPEESRRFRAHCPDEGERRNTAGMQPPVCMIRKENEIMKKFDNIFEQAREIIRQQWTLQDLRRKAQCTGRPEEVRQQIAAARLRLICARRGYQLNA